MRFQDQIPYYYAIEFDIKLQVEISVNSTEMYEKQIWKATDQI